MATSSIVLIRHGESTFNDLYARTGIDPGLIDAPLSPKGESQVAAARAAAARLDAELVVTSPFTRAIQTARGLFGADRPLLIETLHRERVTASCDIGRSPAALATDFPDLAFDHLDDPWWHAHDVDERGQPVEPLEAVEARVAAFRAWLRGRPERRIAVVGHSAFFYHLTGQRFANCQMLAFAP
ncbi:MAG: histidine phosphatase family protein [Rhodospirillales bacterium]|nr:MAG: histidine phosphatase family protein [Rhodospirillales bacterium]